MGIAELQAIVGGLIVVLLAVIAWIADKSYSRIVQVDASILLLINKMGDIHTRVTVLESDRRHHVEFVDTEYRHAKPASNG
jgi:hypothetical protein